MSGRARARMVAAGLVAAALGRVAAQPAQPPVVPGRDSGKDLYLAYCAARHGADAKGHGPVSPSLRATPTDLTTLSAGNRGVFPAAFVRESIVEGRRAHGSPDMPTWGPAFRAMAGDLQAALRLAALVGYIEEIQEKPGWKAPRVRA